MATSATPARPTAAAAALRFEASLGALPRAKALAAAAELDLDRLPDFGGKVRLLLTPADAKRLLDLGIEVHLLKALPVKPFDAKRVMSDEQAKGWLDEQLRGVPRQSAPREGGP